MFLWGRWTTLMRKGNLSLFLSIVSLFLFLKEAVEWGKEPGGGSTWFFLKLHISSLPLSLWVTRLHHQVIWGTRILRTFYFSSDQLTLEMRTECLISQQKGTLPSGEQNSHHPYHFPLREHHLITNKAQRALDGTHLKILERKTVNIYMYLFRTCRKQLTKC